MKSISYLGLKISNSKEENKTSELTRRVLFFPNSNHDDSLALELFYNNRDKPERERERENFVLLRNEMKGLMDEGGGGHALGRCVPTFHSNSQLLTALCISLSHAKEGRAIPLRQNWVPAFLNSQ